MPNFLISDEIIQSVIEITKQAGAVIMDVYKTNFEIHIKNDKSPVTEADTRANDIITAGLLKIAPDIPVLSEEGRNIPFSESGSSIIPPYSISKFICCINSIDSIRPSANAMAISVGQLASKIIFSPFDAGTFTCTIIVFGRYAFANLRACWWETACPADANPTNITISKLFLLLSSVSKNNSSPKSILAASTGTR